MLSTIEKIWAHTETAVVGVVLIVLTFWVARCTAGHDAVIQERVKVLTHNVMVAETLYVRDTLVAYRTRTRYDSARVTDTVTRNDTVYVRRDIADTAIHACTQALHQCDRLRVVNDSLVVQLKKQRKGWTDRLGCSVGPTAVYSAGAIKAGVGATCGVRVWP